MNARLRAELDELRAEVTGLGIVVSAMVGMPAPRPDRSRPRLRLIRGGGEPGMGSGEGARPALR